MEIDSAIILFYIHERCGKNEASTRMEPRGVKKGIDLAKQNDINLSLVGHDCNSEVSKKVLAHKNPDGTTPQDTWDMWHFMKCNSICYFFFSKL